MTTSARCIANLLGLLSATGSGAAEPAAQFAPAQGNFILGCAGCHGPSGSGSRAPILIRRQDQSGPMNSIPCLVPCIRDSTVMALHSPYATVIWDYINRGMPLGREGSLKPNEVYALTAFLLFKNDVVKETDVLDAKSLPKVVMPNKDGAAAAPEWKPKTPRLVGYP